MCYIEVTFCYFEYVILICVSVMLKNVFFIGLRERGRGEDTLTHTKEEKKKLEKTKK